MHFTKLQISELMRKHAEKENGVVFQKVCLEEILKKDQPKF